MKLSILFFAILGISAAAALPSGKVLDRSTRDLSDDLNDFLVLVPTDDIFVVLIQYLAEDEQVQAVVAYVLSDEFKALVLAVNANPEYIEFLNYLQNAGLDVYKWVNAFLSILELEELPVPASSSLVSRLVSTRISGGLAGLIADIKAILPLAELRALYEEKLQTSEDFAALVALLSSDEALELLGKLRANEEFQNIVAQATAAGLDIEALVSLINSIFGIELRNLKKRSLAARDLGDDLDELLALVDVDAVFTLIIVYLSEDEEVQAALEYILSDEFKDLVLAVNAIPEYIEFLNYLQNAGLDVYTWVNTFLNLLGLDELPSASRSISIKRLISSRTTGGLAGLLADLKAILPLDEIAVLYAEKLETSEDFANLITLLGSDEVQELAKELLANPEVQNIIAKLNAAGIDVESIIDLIKTILKW